MINFQNITPYTVGMLKIAFTTSLYINTVILIGTKNNDSKGINKYYKNLTISSLAYLAARGIPTIIMKLAY